MCMFCVFVRFAACCLQFLVCVVDLFFETQWCSLQSINQSIRQSGLLMTPLHQAGEWVNTCLFRVCCVISVHSYTHGGDIVCMCGFVHSCVCGCIRRELMRSICQIKAFSNVHTQNNLHHSPKPPTHGLTYRHSALLIRRILILFTCAFHLLSRLFLPAALKFEFAQFHVERRGAKTSFLDKVVDECRRGEVGDALGHARKQHAQHGCDFAVFDGRQQLKEHRSCEQATSFDHPSDALDQPEAHR
mmetsp:Transcript_41219/g.102919  ORF Transcript_41219/g.102919 Transcript_41219/m.102919 type:complete len:245 (+) Transcript_41219:1780-2514(+)